MTRPISAEDYRVRASFEAMRLKLSDGSFADRMDRPLAYWTLPADRGLPLVLLGRTLRELLDTPYDDLAATPGIGLKKLGMMLKLLDRAALQQPLAAESPAPAIDPLELNASATASQNGFNPALVSELMWEQWCDTVRQHGLGQEKLGRLAPSLMEMPTVIWHTPMSIYYDRRLSEIRQFKTHGAKRVRVVLEVFHVVHAMLSSSDPQSTFAVRLLPRFVRPVEEWVTEVLGRSDVPTCHDVRQNLALPLLNQVEVDAGGTVLRLAEHRLGVETEPQTVRLLSKSLGVTRARVYQLLEICSKIMDVRWPEGRAALSQLAEHFHKRNPPSDELALFHRVRDLFYPDEANRTDGNHSATLHLQAGEVAAQETRFERLPQEATQRDVSWS